MATILHVGDETSSELMLRDTLERAGHRPICAPTVADALQALARERVDLVVYDTTTVAAANHDGLALLGREAAHVPIVALTCAGRAATIHPGVVDWLARPVHPEQLLWAVERAMDHARLRRENEALRRDAIELRAWRQVVGDSAAMRSIRQQIADAAALHSIVLVSGETGTGKRVLARAIHDQSAHRDGPFITLDCVGRPSVSPAPARFRETPEVLDEGKQRVESALERAQGGTLLVADVGNLTLDAQAALLHALRDCRVAPRGRAAPAPSDVGMVATTHRDLSRQVLDGTFRGDLLDELRRFWIELPPLRERAEDIPVLAYRFAMQIANEIGKEISAISSEAVALLTAYPWPGNVRELQHVMERAVILCNERVMQAAAFEGLQVPHGAFARDRHAHRPAMDTSSMARGSSANGRPTATVPDGVVLTSLKIDDAERALILRALEVARNNRTRTAELLGISVRTLRNKLNGPRRSVVVDPEMAKTTRARGVLRD